MTHTFLINRGDSFFSVGRLYRNITLQETISKLIAIIEGMTISSIGEN